MFWFKYLVFLFGIFVWYFCYIYNIFILIFLVYRLVIVLVYYVVLFSLGMYGGNCYLVFFLISFIEIFLNWICIVFCCRWVRIWKENVLKLIIVYMMSIDIFFGFNGNVISMYVV